MPRMSSTSRVIVTCGPSYEPLDRVRRLTNFSTGELGMMLAKTLVMEGVEVTIFKGVGATTKLEATGVMEFATNEDLHALFSGIQAKESVTAIFHAAALCDFKLKSIQGSSHQSLSEGKISSRAGELSLTLVPALKLISLLRPLFPKSQIVGWKYEVDGRAAAAIAKGLQQIQANQTDACIVNGPAYGDGFGYLTGGQDILHLQGKAQLCEFLAKRVGRA